MPIKPVEKQRVADEVVEQLRSMILTGKYPVGSKIPPERELAAKLGINRASLREALKKLEHLGLLHIRQGDGTRVRDFMATGGLDLIQHLIPLAAGSKPALIRDLLEFRRLLGREISKLAAARRDADDLARLDALVTRGGTVSTAIELFELDFDFYVALTHATHNQVMLLLINTVREGLRTHGPLLSNLAPTGDAVRAHHRALRDAIVSQTTSKAFALADEHLRAGSDLAARLGGTAEWATRALP